MTKKFSCEIKPYTLKFKQPAQTSRDTMLTREIWTIKIEDNFGRDGFGEIAPLKGLSRELNLDFEKKLNEVSENIVHFLENKSLLQDYPSILFGIETAWLNYKHRDFIFYKTAFTQDAKSIPINALIWMGDASAMQLQIDNILKKEAKCIKLKIGGIDFEQELELLKYIRKYRDAQTLQIRLDANGAFATNEALDKIEQLSQFDIHSIEQPIKPNQEQLFFQIISSSKIPIALDEELIGKNSYQEKWNLLEKLQPHYIVIKPSLHGGLVGSEEWIFIAQQMKVNWWITSTLESNIGLNALAQWCSRYDNCYKTPQGLGTGELYENNFPTHLYLDNYQLYLNK